MSFFFCSWGGTVEQFCCHHMVVVIIAYTRTHDLCNKSHWSCKICHWNPSNTYTSDSDTHVTCLLFSIKNALNTYLPVPPPCVQGWWCIILLSLCIMHLITNFVHRLRQIFFFWWGGGTNLSEISLIIHRVRRTICVVILVHCILFLEACRVI